MASAPKRPTYRAPKGTFSWPKLTTPDTKFKAEGEYTVGLILSANSPEAIAFKTKIDKAAAESLAAAKEKAKNPAEAKKWETKYLPYKMVEDKETGEETGDIEFKFSMKASGVTKAGKPWTRKPALFDAKGSPVVGVEVGGGSVGIIAYQMVPYAATVQSGASVKLSLEAVQILELRTFGERNASSFGFQAEDGFAAETMPQGEEDDTETEDNGSETGGDF